jgi:predicted transcriptional regulator
MTSVRLTPESEQRLAAAARHAGVSKSKLIRDAIDEKVDELLAADASEKGFSGRLAGLEHLVGSVEVEGPISTRRLGDQYGEALAQRWQARKARRASS